MKLILTCALLLVTAGAASGQLFVSDPAGNETVHLTLRGSSDSDQTETGAQVVASGRHFDVAGAFCPRPAKSLKILPPQFPIACGVDSSITHPSMVYVPEGWNGRKYWLGLTQGSRCNHEDGFIRASNDAERWTRFVADDSCPEPLFTHNEFIDSVKGVTAYSDYVSDLNLFMGSDGRMWAMARGTWQYSDTLRSGPGYRVQFSALYVKSSSDGCHWSHAVRCTPITYSRAYQLDAATFMSPSVWIDARGRYRLLAIDGCQLVKDSVAGGGADALEKSANRILLYESPRPDTLWTLIDTVREAGASGVHDLFPAGSGQMGSDWVQDDSVGPHRYAPWHINVVDNGGDDLIILLTAVSHDGAMATHRDIPTFVNLVGTSEDDGRTISVRNKPLITPSPAPTAFDHWYVYRMAGWWEDREGGSVFRLLYSGFNPTLTSEWHTGIGEVEFAIPFAGESHRP